MGARVMGTVMFYHLTRSPAGQTLAAILPRALQAGWRVLIRAAPETLAHLDTHLWDADGFLPHAPAHDPRAGDHPIILGAAASADFDALALVGHAPLDLAEAARLQRVWVLFDAADEGEMGAARSLWKAVSAAHLHAQYWSEEGGKWAMKTAANAPPKP